MENNSNIIDFKALRRKHKIKKMFMSIKCRLKKFFCSEYDAADHDKKKSPHKGVTRDKRL